MDTYSVPQESRTLLFSGVIHNPLHTSKRPHQKLNEDLTEAAEYVEFAGGAKPCIPVNWRFAESISALKGYEGAMVNVLLKRKYGVGYQKVVVNTDHAQLYFMSAFLNVIDPLGEKPIPVAPTDEFFRVFGPDTNLYKQRMWSPCSGIYKTRDDRFYHVHAGLNHTILQTSFGISDAIEWGPYPAGVQAYQSALLSLFPTAEALDAHVNDLLHQEGCICYSKEEYPDTPMGKANSGVGLYEIHHVPSPSTGTTGTTKAQVAGWWDRESEGKATPSRPLSGLKVLDLTRMIAAPLITRELAELGASVLRITAPHVPDLAPINVDVHWGKWNAHLDLRVEEQRERLRELVMEADVVVDGYRPGVLEKYGFGKDEVLGMCEGRERGVVYVRENCYGWYGPWAHRSGWQSISDVNVGVAHEFGRAMGHDEPVMPVYPNADYCTGLAGAIGVLEALIAQSQTGGSYIVDVALNYYSQWLVRSCGTYPAPIWSSLWSSHNNFVFHHHQHMATTIPAFTAMLQANPASPINNPAFFEVRENKAIGLPVKSVKPILSFPEGLVKLGFNVGTRPNGTDKPRWPEDLMTEVIV